MDSSHKRFGTTVSVRSSVVSDDQQGYFKSMDSKKFPALAKVIMENRTAVLSWSVDDVVKALKSVEAAFRKVELDLAKSEADFWRVADVKRGVEDASKQIEQLNERLNRLLGLKL